MILHSTSRILSRLAVLSITGLMAFLHCTQPVAGGTSTTDNPKVVGTIFGEDRRPAQDTRVVLLPEDYDPNADTVAIIADTTDAFGRYSLPVAREGAFNLQAVHLISGTRSLNRGIVVHEGEDSVVAFDDTLKSAGAVLVDLPDSIDRSNGYLYIPGTTVFTTLVGAGAQVVLDSVPADSGSSICYTTKTATEPKVLRYDVAVTPGDTAVVSLPGWQYSADLHLNTTASGAGVAGNVTDFPVLIRLRKGVFPFDRAAVDGRDIRFTKQDGTVLPYEIERWDAPSGSAEIWVKVDTVYGNDSLQHIKVYWGNGAAVDASKGEAVFDTAAGFAGVWHLSEQGAGIRDATVNGIDAVATETGSVAGMIGTAQEFNGSSSLIRAAGAAGDKLNFTETAAYSVSAWVRTDVIDTLFHGVVYKSNFQYGLQIRPDATWEFLTYVENVSWEMSRAPVADSSWHALVGVRDGSLQRLYLDGECVDSGMVTIPMVGTRAFDQPLEIGHCPDGGEDPDRYFDGIIDEVRIANVAYGADWVKLCYMNQKESDVFVRW